MYAADFTSCEKNSWLSSRPAEKATHDNQLCFAKTGNAFALNVLFQKQNKKNFALNVFVPCAKR